MHCSHIMHSTYRLGVGSDNALHQLEDEGCVDVDLGVGERDPLVDEGLDLGIGGEEGGVGRKGRNYGIALADRRKTNVVCLGKRIRT